MVDNRAVDIPADVAPAGANPADAFPEDAGRDGSPILADECPVASHPVASHLAASHLAASHLADEFLADEFLVASHLAVEFPFRVFRGAEPADHQCRADHLFLDESLEVVSVDHLFPGEFPAPGESMVGSARSRRQLRHPVEFRVPGVSKVRPGSGNR